MRGIGSSVPRPKSSIFTLNQQEGGSGVDRLPRMMQCLRRRDPLDAGGKTPMEDVWPHFNEGRERTSVSEEMSLSSRWGSYHGPHARTAK